MGGNCRHGFDLAHMQPGPRTEGPGSSGARPAPITGPGPRAASPTHGHARIVDSHWVAYLRLEDPPGMSPIATVGRFDTVEEA